jgi:large subunit ribosomal protein L21
MSYAIIENGGKQYQVVPGKLVDLEKIEGNLGDTIELQQVSLIHLDDQEIKIGTPLVKNAKVTAEIVLQDRSRKLLVFKKKRRKNYRRTRGHRQSFTRVKIKEITV